MPELSESVDWAKIIGKIVAGGAPSWIAAGVGAILLAILMWWLKKQKRKAIDAVNQKRRENDLAGTVPANQEPSQDWEDAANATENARRRAREELNRNTES